MCTTRVCTLDLIFGDAAPAAPTTPILQCALPTKLGLVVLSERVQVVFTQPMSAEAGIGSGALVLVAQPPAWD